MFETMHSKQAAFDIITELVQRFDEQKESYKKTDYNETLTRKDFIDPFFKALGWDIDNSQGYAEAYREVIHEDKIKIGSATKAPDYSFRLPGGKRLFFVEAKKPSVVVKTEIMPAYQVRRYAWSAKLPVSILTDFEEFAVYDCNKKPKPEDKASAGRIKYLLYNEYIKEFDFIWDTFSKERVLKGSFDKFVASDTGKKGTATVDKEFLHSLDEWRIELAQNIALRNPAFTEEELNYAVQQTIDRIIFLRIAEDRGVEEYGRLKASLKGEAYYSNLFSFFKEADDKYNSGLFDFKRDRLSKELQVDNKVLKNIINELYYPVSPYEFSVLSVEILGSAYEQFLGKQIKLSERHKAVIEEKPEVRKAGGVYYTPQYIVDYIVEQTVGKAVHGKSLKEIEALKIVDPACGSGSFLLGAYQYLLNHYAKEYKPEFERLSAIASSNEYNTKQRNDAIKERSKLPLTPDGALTTAIKKKILLNNIYGVDIDTQAVEVTKLSLLLKCMEGETQSSMAAEMRFGERILPTLDNNIKSGNSLIDLDFYDGEFDFEPGAEKKIKPFSWEKAFPEVFKNGGFDVVIGNPPWGASLNDFELKYLKQKHSSIVVRMVDSYIYFINFSIKLLKENGLYGVIIPSTFLNQNDVSLLRKRLLRETGITAVINLGEKIFGSNVQNTSTILALSINKNQAKLIVGDLRNVEISNKPQYLNQLMPTNSNQWKEMVEANEYFTYLTYNLKNLSILEKLKSKFKTLGEIIDGEIQRGISPDYAKAFIVSEEVAAELRLEKAVLKPLVLGKHIVRYNPIDSKDWIIYLTKKDNIDDYPNIKNHLQKFRKFITCREVAEGKHPWYSLHRPRDPNIFIGRKIIGLTTSKVICTSIDEDGYYATDALYLFKVKKDKGISEEFVVGVIQSKLFQFLYDLNIQGGQRVIPQIKAANLYNLPFPDSQKEIHDAINSLVKIIVSLNKEKQQTTLPEKLEQLQHRMDYTDDKINKLVYELYGLTEEETKIVENS
jgi:type I restriction-modification system DNA methylase subunit